MLRKATCMSNPEKPSEVWHHSWIQLSNKYLLLKG